MHTIRCRAFSNPDRTLKTERTLGALKPVIGHSLRLDDFRQAFELGESGKAGGKIVLTIDG